ncbi:MAG: hypothetical protein WCD81_10260 [Candidatus Bathyarchaeia archaeon]
MVRRSVAIALGAICIILVVVGLVGAVTYIMPMINDKNNTISSLNTQISQLTTNNTNLQSWLAGNITAYNNYVSDHHYTDEEYNSLNSIYQDYEGNHTHTNGEYNSLQNQYNAYVADHSYTNEQYNAYVADHHYTDEQYTNLLNIVNLADSTIWVDDQTVSEPAGGLGIAWNDWTYSASYAGYVTIDVLSSTTGAWTHVVYSAYGVDYNVEINVGTGGTAYFPVLPSSSITVGVGNGNLSGGATQTVTITYHY